MNIARIPLASRSKIIAYIIQGVLAILVFGQLDKDCSDASIQSRDGALFF